MRIGDRAARGSQGRSLDWRPTSNSPVLAGRAFRRSRVWFRPGAHVPGASMPTRSMNLVHASWCRQGGPASRDLPKHRDVPAEVSRGIAAVQPGGRCSSNLPYSLARAFLNLRSTVLARPLVEVVPHRVRNRGRSVAAASAWASMPALMTYVPLACASAPAAHCATTREGTGVCLGEIGVLSGPLDQVAHPTGSRGAECVGAFRRS